MLLDPNRERLDKVHNRAEQLTGDRWIPYVSSFFAEVSLKQNDETFIELVKKRRTFFFPQFLRGEPQFKELMCLMGELGDN